MPSRNPKDSLIELSSLQPNDRNPRKITPDALAKLSASIERDPQFMELRPIVVDGDSMILGGHQRFRACQQLGMTAVPSTWVRTAAGLTAEQRKRFILVDNAPDGMSGDWDVELLTADWQMPELDDLGFDMADMAATVDDNTGGADVPFSVYAQDVVVDAGYQHYRASGMPDYKSALHAQMMEINKLAALDGEALRVAKLAYHVADAYHVHRLSCGAIGMRSPVDAFRDDVAVRKTLRMNLDQGNTTDRTFLGTLSIVNGTQGAFNFRPGYAAWIYRKFAQPGGLVIDPCHGFGGRLVGWIASRLGGRYIGVDPSVATHKANIDMAAALHVADATDMICAPFEDADLSAHYGKASLVFTSPPYFAKELYADEETQSSRRFPAYDSWVIGLLVPTMQKSFALLQPGAPCVINIDDVKIGAVSYPLTADAVAAALYAGFALEEKLVLENPGKRSEGMEETAVVSSDDEPVLVFRKPVDA